MKLTFPFLIVLILKRRIGSVRGNCSLPFDRNFSDACLHVSEENRVNYCQSHDYCARLGGELISGEENLNKIKGKINLGKSFFIGLNDAVEVRYKNATGWKFTNGKILNDTSFWMIGEPNGEGIVGEGADCVLNWKSSHFLLDFSCVKNARFTLCQPKVIKTPPRQKIWKAIDFGSPQDDKHECFDAVDHVSVLRCALMCAGRPTCPSFYYNKKLEKCVLLKYYDAMLMGYTAAEGWRKFS